MKPGDTIRRAALGCLVVGAVQLAAPAAVPWLSLSGSASATERQPRDAYIEQNEGRFEQWGRKIDAFNETARQKGAQAKQSADRRLEAAWHDVKRHWGELKSAGAERWEDTKAALDESWRRLERAWEDAQS